MSECFTDKNGQLWGYQSGEAAFVAVMPGRLGGKPTVGHSRLSTAMVADYYWNVGYDEVQSMYELTLGEVVVAVWFEARYGSRTHRKRWAEWLAENEAQLWSPSHHGNPQAPPTKAAPA